MCKCSLFKLTSEELKQCEELEKFIEEAIKDGSMYEASPLELHILEGFIIFILSILVYGFIFR